MSADVSVPSGPSYHVHLVSSRDIAPDSPEYEALRVAVGKINSYGARKRVTPRYHVEGPPSWRWACIAAVSTCPTRHGTLLWPDGPAPAEAVVYLGDPVTVSAGVPLLDLATLL